MSLSASLCLFISLSLSSSSPLVFFLFLLLPFSLSLQPTHTHIHIGKFYAQILLWLVWVALIIFLIVMFTFFYNEYIIIIINKLYILKVMEFKYLIPADFRILMENETRLCWHNWKEDFLLQSCIDINCFLLPKIQLLS